MRVLVLVSDRWSPPVTATRVINLHLWPALAQLGVEVRILGLDYAGALAAMATHGGDEAEFFAFDREPLPVRTLHALTRSYHEWPTSSTLHRAVDIAVGEWRAHVVHAEELRMAAYLPERPATTRSPLLSLRLHNVESDLQRLTGSSAVRFGHRLIDRLHHRTLLRFERASAERVDIAFTFSRLDCERYRQLYPRARWAESRNGTNAAGVTPAPQVRAGSALFVGSLSYAPNVRGLLWFLDAVWPLLRGQVPLTIAGSHAVPELRRRLARESVRFLDTPGDLTRLYAEHALCVVPVLEGSGTRGKILEALAHGRVVVSTSLGAAGLELGPTEGVVTADDPQTFAREVANLAADPHARDVLGRAGRARVEERYDWSVVAGELLEAWTRCASR